jgi:ABC-type uncharacterized transport system involved in gliding motility auxiliary subunit
MKPIPRRLFALTALILTGVIFFAVNIAADATLTTERLDLTENKLFTLSPGTRQTIVSLKEPITLKFFYSKKVAARYAQISAYAGRVRDLLEQYAALSHGKIVLEEIDPEPFTAAEDEATADGLSGASTDSGDMVYLGLVGTNTIDGKQVIPFFSQDREPYLEYDITALIYRLATPKKPVLGIISSLPLETGMGGMAAAMQGHVIPFTAYDELSQSYRTRMLETDFTSIPKDVDVLMIAQPKALTAAQRYAIDQFVLNGGRALIFVDPLSEVAAHSSSNPQMQGPDSSDLPELFKAWGIAYDPRKVILDGKLAQRVQVSLDARNPVAVYPAWLHLTEEQFDSQDQVTASLQSLNLASVGALSKVKGATTHFAPLVTSSNDASLIDAEAVQITPRPQDLIDSVHPTGKPYVIAARISGPAKTAFPDGPPAGNKVTDKQIKAAKAINVIVMADTDIFDDRFWVRTQDLYGKRIATPFADNGAFVLNAVENLSGSGALISLRTRASNDRPFTVVQQLQAQAQAQFQEEADALQAKLTDTENHLHALEQGGSTDGKPSTGITLSSAQQTEINKFRADVAATRMQLREVQHSLRREVDALGTLLEVINIVLVPLLVAAFALLLAILRRRRRARAVPL